MLDSPYVHLKNALVAEDDEDLRELLKEKIESCGIKCTAVSNGEQAFHELMNFSYDLLLTDFKMPILDGVQLLEKCRQNGIHIPVIFHSANADLARREQIALADCCATLMYKPINHEVFMAALGAADNRSHHLNCIHNRKSPVK